MRFLSALGEAFWDLPKIKPLALNKGSGLGAAVATKAVYFVTGLVLIILALIGLGATVLFVLSLF